MEKQIIKLTALDIGIEILKQSYIDLRLVPTMTVYGDSLSNIPNINEGVGSIVSPNDVVHKIIQKYHLSQRLVEKIETNNKIYIYIITACIGDNDKLIEDDMKRLGYSLSDRGQVQNIQGMQFQTLRFEPYNQIQK